jgi:hypothetical protein
VTPAEVGPRPSEEVGAPGNGEAGAGTPAEVGARPSGELDAWAAIEAVFSPVAGTDSSIGRRPEGRRGRGGRAAAGAGCCFTPGDASRDPARAPFPVRRRWTAPVRRRIGALAWTSFLALHAARLSRTPARACGRSLPAVAAASHATATPPNPHAAPIRTRRCRRHATPPTRCDECAPVRRTGPVSPISEPTVAGRGPPPRARARPHRPGPRERVPGRQAASDCSIRASSSFPAVLGR